MAKRPNKVNRSWKPKRVKQQRSVDMSWYYNDSRWRKFSKRFKEENPLCVKCNEQGEVSPSKYTDHIQRLRDGGAPDLNELKEENFQPLCEKCHASKSGREAHGYKEGMGSNH